MSVSLLVVVVVVTALAFDFTNGFHDTANAMATSIATGALPPRVAVLVSAVMNLVGAFLSTEVARTISSGIVDDSLVTPAIVFGGLVGAIVWNLGTWLLGLPSSSSHALFGGLIGAVWVAAGSDAVRFGQVMGKIVIPAFASPFIAGLVALVATFLAYRITARARPRSRDVGFKVGQTASATLVSLAHGTGDAQKTMGVITLVLISTGALDAGSGPPVWVILAAGLAIAVGTATGGWRIIRTMGTGLTEVHSPQGFAAETASTAVLLSSAHLGFALSTTQVCSGSIVGTGLGARLASIRWRLAGRMALGWVLTLPAAALVGAGGGALAGTGDLGVVVVAVLAVAVVGLLVQRSRRDPVTSRNVNDAPRPARGRRVAVGAAA